MKTISFNVALHINFGLKIKFSVEKQMMEIEPLNFHYEYSDDKWKLAKKIGKKHYGRLIGHSLHYIGPYSGSFPPELVHYFLFKYSNPNDLILDPFSGRGTTGLQAVLNNRQTIVNDANPLAYLYSFAKLYPLTSQKVINYLQTIPIEDTFFKLLTSEKKSELLSYFHEETLKEILSISHYLRDDPSPQSKYIQSLLAGTLRGNRISNLSITMSALICFSANYMKKWTEKTEQKAEYREVKPRLIQKAERLEKNSLNFRKDSVVLQEDSTNLAQIESRFIDTIITSPPYFNVINYAYDNRLRLWILGYNYKEVQKRLCQTSSIAKYTEFIQQSIKEMYRVLKDDSWAIIIVGDVKRTATSKGKRKTIIINTAEIIAHAAIKNGFELKKIINDTLPDEKGTCGRATSLTNRYNVKLDRCVVLSKGNPDFPDHEINWKKMINSNIR